MATIKTLYPSTSSTALTCDLSSLATSSTFVAGRASTAVDNTTNLDTDHLLSVQIRGGTTPTVGTQIGVFVYACISTASGTPTYPDSITGSDAAKTMTSTNVMNSALVFVTAITVDNTTDRYYYFGPISIASLFGGVMPKFWGVYISNASVANLHATAGSHVISYSRVQMQTV